MKTIIHLELSDEERNDLAARIRRDPDTTLYATRKEITEHVLDFINQEIKNARVQETQATPCKPEPKKQAAAFIPSRGDEDYLTQPKDPDIAAACHRILDDTALIEQFAWDTIERNRK
jgi:hypothetical protein